MIDRRLLRVVFYEASDGPRIMLFGPSEVDLTSLRDCFRRLSAGEASLELHNQPFVFAPENIQISLLCKGDVDDVGELPGQQGIRRIRGEPCSYRWEHTNVSWLYLAQLIDGLTMSEAPGHQYLSHYPDEDAIVVVSKGEYGDDVMK